MVAVVITFSAFAADMSDAQRAAIEERITPHGQSCLEGDGSCASAVSGQVAGGAARSGEEVYNSACLACHSTGAGGAPKLGDAPAWTARIAKGMDALYVSGTAGVAGTSMMAKGGCMNCSDEEIHAAVDYMVEGSR